MPNVGCPKNFEPIVYVPYAQRPQPNMFAFARTSVLPESLTSEFNRQMYAMDPFLLVPALMPLSERFDRAYAFERNMTVLFFAFAVVALLLASIGLFASVSHSMSQRTHEIGIRTALGASSRHIRGLVFAKAGLPLALGLGLGLAGSFAVNRLLAAQLVDVSPVDPAALVLASATLTLAAIVGCLVPAYRASHIDPVVALRQE